MRSRYRLGTAVEIILGAGLVSQAIAAMDGPAIRLWPSVAYHGAVSVISLQAVDGVETLRTAGLLVGRLALAAFPSVLLIWRAPRHRKLWLVPVVAAMFAFASLPSLTACETPLQWLVLAVVAALVTVTSRVKFLGWTALLPVVLMLGSLPRHWVGESRGLEPAERERLLAECVQHEGVRPVNLGTEFIMPYFGITSLTDDLILLTGRGQEYPGGPRPPQGSWWLRRRNGRFEFEQPSAAWGNLWRGCVLDETIWLARRNYLIATKRLGDDPLTQESVTKEWIPAHEFDFADAACDADAHRVYVGETTRGGLWEFNPTTGDMRRHQIGGRIIMPQMRFDGMLVLTNTAELMVWAPDERRVVERQHASIVAGGGFALCSIDGAVAIADLAGRLRIFEMDPRGEYRFAWALSMFAPRRVAFSPDCTRLAVTSADDRHVYMIDRSTRRVVETHLAGPALREVVSTGPHEFSITDVCSVTSYAW